MPKLSEFRKSLRLELKLAKHVFRNMDYKSHKDPPLEYIFEGMDERLKKSMKKDNRGQHPLVCA